MRFFALARDLTLDTDRIRRSYAGADDLQALTMERLYLDVGAEAYYVGNQLKKDLELLLQASAGKTDEQQAAQSAEVLSVVQDEALLGWAHFPTRLGRISAFASESGLQFHPEEQILPAQLQALRARKPAKHHWRFAIVNGFGANLGDCTIGITAFRQVLECLRQYVPSLSCDILFGPGTSAATVDILGDEPGVERVRFHALTAAEFAQYDGYFDFSNFTAQPGFKDMPPADWLLWWCGLAPQVVPAEHKRNRGRIHQDAWQAVQALLREQPGPKVLFNPKASVPLRSMPPKEAADFVLQLLQLAPELTWVLDQPLDCQHPRLLDLSGKIDSPEKFKALVAHMDGVITVDTLALHQADISAIPTVTLHSSTMPGAYAYYPYNAGLGIPGLTTLPAYQRTKVDEAEWDQIKDVYYAAWAGLKPAEVLALLREKMLQRQQVGAAEPSRLTIGPSHPPPSCVVLDGRVPRLQRQRLAPAHIHASERFARLAQPSLRPGAVCVMACAPDAKLALTVAERIAPQGELIVLEPRAALARNLEAALHLAGLNAARVLQAVSMEGGAQARIDVLDAWSESHSSDWGNLPAVTTVPSQPLDSLALQRCNVVLVQSPMPYVPFIAGALDTLKRCRPLILLSPVSQAEAAAIIDAAQAADYDFRAESALPGTTDVAAQPAWLVIGTPRQRSV